MRKTTFLCVAVYAGLLLPLGCDAPMDSESQSSSAHDHDHDHDHGTVKPGEMGLDIDSLPHGGLELPESYDEAQQLVVEMVATISSGMSKGDVDSVHGELHDVGMVLEHAEELAEDSEQSKEIMAAYDSLLDLFGEVDAKLHGLKGKDFSEVKDDIEAAVKTISGQ